MSRCRKFAVSQETSFGQLLLLLLPSNRNWRYEKGKEGLREEGGLGRPRDGLILLAVPRAKITKKKGKVERERERAC